MSTYSETFHALRPTAKVVAVSRAHVDLRRGVRLGMGVFVPLAAGVLLGHPEYGVFAALGALTAGFAATTGARAGQHAYAVLLSGLGMAVSGFAGAALAQRPWALLGVLVAASVWRIVRATSSSRPCALMCRYIVLGDPPIR